MRIMAEVEGMEKLNEILSPEYVTKNISADLESFATDLHQEIKESSPVDEGEYQRGWGEGPKKVNDLEFLIENRVGHAKYLVYGILRWKAKFPRKQRYMYPNRSEGALHDIKKIIFLKMRQFQSKVNK
jgi:hypothetical protein